MSKFSYDEKKLPVVILYEFLISLRHGWLSYKVSDYIKNRFKLKDDAEINEKYKELKEDFEKDPDKYYLQLLRSKTTTLKLIEKQRKRFSEKVEEKLFAEYKDSPVYFRYCEIFNIIVDNYEQVVTEVALDPKVSYNKKSYLDSLLKRRRLCKGWIIDFLKHKSEINENDSIKTLLDNL